MVQAAIGHAGHAYQASTLISSDADFAVGRPSSLRSLPSQVAASPSGTTIWRAISHSAGSSNDSGSVIISTGRSACR